MSQAEQDRPPVLRATRERPRAKITRQILDTARRHLATEGASGPSLRAIAREPGGSLPAVYRYVAESVRRWAEQLGIAPSHSGTAPDARQLRPDGQHSRPSIPGPPTAPALLGKKRAMNSALPGEARAPRAAEAERAAREVVYLGWRLDASGMPAQPVAPSGLWYALTAAFPRFRPAVGIELTHAAPADGELGFDPVLRDLAAHAGMATARSTAKNAECPSAHLQLAGSPWPWRPATPFAFTIAAAIDVALLPAAAARRHRP